MADANKARPPLKPKQRKLTRRKFLLATVGLVGGGLGLRWLTHEEPKLRNSADVLEPNAFLQITPEGEFIFQLDRVEMGQGTMTGLATLLAEELDIDPARLDIRFAPVLSTFQRPIQMTGQSRSLVDGWEILRETGATARAMLIEAAAERWQVDAKQLITANGVVVNTTNDEEIAYADLAARAAKLAPPWNIELKSPEDWRWIGTFVPRLDALDKVTGQAGYGIDVQLDGMLTAVLVRCPERGAKITSFDASVASAMPGVKSVLQVSNGIAVVARDFWSARQAAAKIALEWEPGPLAEKSDGSILSEQRQLLSSSEPDYEHISGDSDGGAQAAAQSVQVEYIAPYLAHATMEPMNATALVSSDACEVWVPSQAPDIARQAACDVTGLSRSQVNVHTTYLGGGFGRRAICDYVSEAVEIAQSFDVPIKLVWTREDDMQHGFYRQQTVHQCRGHLDEDRGINWWEHQQVAAGTGDLLTPPMVSTVLSEKISSQRRAQFGNWLGGKMVDWFGAFQAREGAKELIYAIPNRRLTQTTFNPGVPITIWRSVGNSYNGFVIESFMDELAHLAGADPLSFRRGYLHEQPECLAVLERLKKLSNWGELTPGRFKGLAIYKSFGAIVGQVAEVTITNNFIRVPHVYCVVDCGTVVTPDIVRSQMESGIIFGLTAALYGEINIDSGRIRQSNFHDYPMIRMADAPSIDVEIIPSTREPAGVGEPGTPPIAAAVANAVFAATGTRLRKLPLRL